MSTGAPYYRMRDIRDPLTWVSSFMTFVATRSDNEKTRDTCWHMASWSCSSPESMEGWAGELMTDHQFRRQAAAGSTAPWSELNLLLMASTVFAAGGKTPTI